MGMDFRGDPSSALLEVPTRSRTTVHRPLREVEYDLSDVGPGHRRTMNTSHPLSSTVWR
jgi:ATP-dependent Lon protease